MFGIGLPELLLIMGLGLIVLGPDKLPDLAKQLAKGMVELKRTANSLKDSLQEEMKDEDGTPLLDDLTENAGQPWRGLDGKGGMPTDNLPEGFDEFGVINTSAPGKDFGVNDPADAPVAAEAGAETPVDQPTGTVAAAAAEPATKEPAPAATSVSTPAPEVKPESVVAETPNEQGGAGA